MYSNHQQLKTLIQRSKMGHKVRTDSDFKSPYYNDMKDNYIEDFRGFRKDLRDCEFWSKVQFDTPERLKSLMVECKKKPMSYGVQSTGDFSRIKHITFWNDEHQSFMTWSHTPRSLMDGSDPFMTVINK